VLFLIATTIYYITNKKLRTNSGLSFLLFIIPSTVDCICLAILHESRKLGEFLNPFLVLFGCSCALTFLWMSMMNFDIFWTFCSFRTPTENLKRFKFYCLYVAIVILTVVLAFIVPSKFARIIKSCLTWMFETLAVFNVIFILLTGYKIFKLSKTLHLSEQSRFKEETGK
jgi:hypothetical protein